MRYLALFKQGEVVYSVDAFEEFRDEEQALIALKWGAHVGMTAWNVIWLPSLAIMGGLAGTVKVNDGETIGIIAYTGKEVEKWMTRN